MRRASKKRLKNLILYILQKYNNNKLTETKLQKLLYFCDFGYYQENEDTAGWKNYQEGKLKNLGVGVLGEDFVFPAFNTPMEALDGIMALVAKESAGKPYRVFVTYGTTRRPSDYLQLKSFGSFIEKANVVESQLKQERSDLMARPKVAPTSDEEVNAVTDAPDDAPWAANS